MKLKASIDIGSNSILLLVINMSENKMQIIENHSLITGLGRDLDKNGVFIEASMEDSLNALIRYASICNKHGIPVESIIVTATEASRVAKNAKTFFTKVRNECGLIIKTISAEAEAYYSTVGILMDKNIKDEEVCIMDIGGASTELIRVDTKSKKIIESFSMPVGAVRMNNWQEQGTRDLQLHQILSEYDLKLARMSCKTLYCVAGTMTSVGNIHLNNRTFEEDEVNGLRFSIDGLNNIQQTFQNKTPDEFLEEFPFLGKRSKTIMSGIVLASAILKNLEVEQVYISTYGLRYGTVMIDCIPDKYILI